MEPGVFRWLFAKRPHLVNHDAPLRSDHLYVCPAGCDLEISDGCLLALRESDPPAFIAPSIDRLFRSVAACFGGQSVGVILSGSGHDGAAGAAAIAAAGGQVIVQSPEEATQASMPKAALAEPQTALCGRTEQMTGWLNRIKTLREQRDDRPQQPAAAPFDELIALVSQTTGLDLGQYKETTLRRQAARRYHSVFSLCPPALRSELKALGYGVIESTGRASARLPARFNARVQRFARRSPR